MTVIQDSFAANVRRYRKAAHLSQEKLAELAGLHRTYIGGIEQCRVNVSLKNIEKIANALKVDPSLLLIPSSCGNSVHPSFHDKLSPRELKSSFGHEGLTDDSTNEPNYALMIHEGDCAMVRPVEVAYEDLTVQILSNLILNGHHGDELADLYAQINHEIILFLENSRFAQPKPKRQQQSNGQQPR